MSTFLAAYIECAMWAEGLEGRKVALETMVKAANDCAAFVAANEAAIAGRYEEAGHDFWLTRNGHGAGFWDGDWPEAGDALTVAAKAFGEVNLYVGDDGFVYG